MGMTVKRRKDSDLKRYIMHRIADIRGGISVIVSEIVRDFLPEGTVISAPDSNAKCHIVKYAKLTANLTDSATTIKIAKGSDFKVGDFVCLGENKAAYAISSIDTSNASYDELTVGTTLGEAASSGAYIYQAAASGASGSALKYEPFAVTGTGKPVDSADNFDVDAWVIAVVKGADIPALIAGKLKGIINY